MSNPQHRPDQWDPEAALASLQEMGLTRSQADLYLIALAQGPDAEFTAEELARLTGRGAHNLERSLEALARHDAVEIVGDSPARFRVTAADDFTDRQLELFGDRCRRTAEALRRVPPPARDLAIEPVETREEILTAARRLLSGCRRHLTVHGSTEFLQDLGADLEDLAGRHTVRVLSPVPMTSAAVQISVCQKVPEGRSAPDSQWLQMVVDGRSWLAAGLGSDADQEPAGWCLEDSRLAAVLGLGLEQAWNSGSVVATQGLARPTEPAAAGPSDGEIMFLVRHDIDAEMEAKD